MKTSTLRYFFIFLLFPTEENRHNSDFGHLSNPRVLGFLQIADFGLSNLYHKDKLLQTFCGSPLYASPEIVNGRPYRGPEVGAQPIRAFSHSSGHDFLFDWLN